MKTWQLPALFALCAFGLGNNAMANLTFSGTLIAPPPCTINGGSNIDIDFLTVGINSINGQNYQKLVNFTFSCTASTLPWTMKLSIQGTATSFDPTAIQTSVGDLGVRILKDNLPFALNTPVTINPLAPPVLKVVPVKRPGSSPASGGFVASATLLAYYQ